MTFTAKGMEIDWNVAPINGTGKNCFFTRESFARYSVQPSFIGTLDLESSDGSEQLPTSLQNSVSDTSIQKSDAVRGKKTKNTEAAGSLSCTAIHAEISPKNQATNDKKLAKWMLAKMGLKVPYPRPSSMTKLEQKTYLALSDQFRHMPPLDQQDKRLFSRLKELQMKVTAEQEEYMAYLEGVARQFVADYNTVHPVVEKFVLEYLEKRRRNVYRYPRCYILHDTVPVAPSKGQLDVSLTHISTLLEMGTVAKMILHSMGDSSGDGVTKVPLDYNRVSKRYPQCSSEPSGTAAGEYTKAPISRDANVDRLLTKYEADLAMSLGAFQCLIDNYPHNINRQWELAVTVKEYDVTANGEVIKQKVVCLDSPFISKTITPQEKNLIYHKLALKTLLLHPNHHNACTLETKLDYFSRAHKQEGDCSESASSENLFADAADDLSSLEVFGTDAQDRSLNKCVVSADLAMSDDDSDTSSSDTSDLPTESAVNDAQTDDVSPASDDVHPRSTGPPLSPIPCLDGLVDEKPRGGEAEGEEKGECSSGRRRRSSRSQKKSADDELRGSTGSGVRSNVSTPRRSMRLASRGKIPDFELTDSDNDDNLFIDCTSPKGSSDSLVQSKLPRGNQSLQAEESGDVGKVICMQNPTKDSSSSKTVSCDVYLETPSADVSSSAIQLLAEGEPKETKIAFESTVQQPFGQPGSPKPKEVCKGLQALEESDAKSTSESVVDESCGTLDSRSLSESAIGDCIPKMKDVAVENPLSSASSQTSSTGITQGTSTNESTDGKPAKIKCRGKKRRCSAVHTLTEVKVEDATLVPSASVMPVAKRTRGRAKEVNVPVNKDSSLCDVGSGDGKLIGEVEARSSIDASGTKTKNESEIALLPLATPNEQTAAKTPLEKSAAQKTRKRSVAPPVSKSLANDIAVPSVSSISKSSANDQPLVFQSFLDQLLTEQTKMFDRRVGKQPPIGPAVQTLALSVPPAATITVSSEARQPVSLLDDRAVSGPTSMMGDGFQQHSGRKVATLADAASVEMMSENPGEYVRPSVGNVAYHIWSLGSLKFILRHNHHGIYRPYHQKLSAKLPVPYFMHIQAKLEHQAEHGVEQMTPSEAIRSWTALQLKLRTRLLRAHINASSSEVFLYENLDQNPLLQKANPSASLASVHLLLERLTKLGVGTYLIGHMPGSQHIQIKKTTQAERGVYDLHLAYQSTETVLNQPTSSTSYWLPINPIITLRYHNKYFRVPCTFEPKDSAMVNTAQQPNFRKNTKKKGKKNS